jgi:hypothetical protein
MSEDFDEVLSAALSLSPGARAMLAGHLLRSLDVENQTRLDSSEIVVQPQTEGEWTLEELLAGVTNANLHGAVSFGPPVGNEVL